MSRYCLAYAQCPVLTVPPPPLARETRRGALARAFWHRTLTADQSRRINAAADWQTRTRRHRDYPAINRARN